MGLKNVQSEVFNSFEDCNLVLMKDTRNYSPTSYFWVSTAAIEWSKSKVYNMKSFSKLGLCKVGASAIASLSS